MNSYDVRSRFQGAYATPRSSTRYLVVHHAAAIYRSATGLEDVAAVAHYHTKTKGWPGIGYHIALAEAVNGGAIERFDLSDLGLQRAHIAHRNHDALGVACLTNFTGMPAQKWIDALALVLAELRQKYPAAQIVGHGEIAYGPRESPDGKDWRTACPGPAWQQWKPQLLAKVAAMALAPAAPRSYRVVNTTPVYTDRKITSPIAFDGTAVLQAGHIIEVDDITAGWAHWQTGIGFVPMNCLVAVDELTFVARPRISLAQFRRVLDRAASPAASAAEALYYVCTAAGIDPAVALAFFGHESSFGKAGICFTHNTRNWGNVRRPHNPARGKIVDIPGRGPFAVFETWQLGLADWCDRMLYAYGRDRGLYTVEAALPVYAPSSDNNNPARYAAAVRRDVAAWMVEDRNG